MKKEGKDYFRFNLSISIIFNILNQTMKILQIGTFKYQINSILYLIHGILFQIVKRE